MDGGIISIVSEPRDVSGRPEPRWITLADLAAIVAGVALVLAIASRAPGWPGFAPPSALLLVLIGCQRLTMAVGLVLAFVVLFRRAQYGGLVRPAEWLALGLASLGLLQAVPNLDEAVNAYYAATGSSTLDFDRARWLVSAPAAAGLVLVVPGLIFLLRRARDGSHVASALAVVGTVGALMLWFWGPCEVARLALPPLLVPGPQGDPSSWGWRSRLVLALREPVANGLTAFTWSLPAAAMVRVWWADRRRGRPQARVWTELAAFADVVVAALPLVVVGLTAIGSQATAETVWDVSWLAGIALVSWWITGLLGFGRPPSPLAPASVA